MTVSDNSSGRGMRTILIILLCGMFFVLAMGVTLLGSGVYQKVVAASDTNYTHRTGLSFLVNQLRRGDNGAAQVTSFGGQDALFLYDGYGYVTALYCYDGQLRELYMAQDAALQPEDGMEILPLQSLKITQEGALIVLSADDGTGVLRTVTVAPRCGIADEGSASL